MSKIVHENSGFDGDSYLKRLSDRECPVPYDSPFLLPLRPDPPTSQHNTEPPLRHRFPPVTSPEEKDRLASLYYSCASQPASQHFSSFPDNQITEILPGAAWVFKLFTPEECQHVIDSGEQHGLHGAKDGVNSARTSKRTNDWMFPSLSTLVSGKLPTELLDLIEATSPYTSVRGIHPNWRVARYEPGQTFAAHFDNSDTITVIAKDGAKEKATSSHTLLVHLMDRSSYGGGATRLFPLGRYDEGAVDVQLPQGFALVFQQKGLLHAGLPVEKINEEGNNVKYIAQAGVLRGQAEVKPGRAPSVFKFGPGFVG